MGDAECYLLDAAGNVLGPYPRQTVHDWFATGQIAPEQNMSVGPDGAWQEVQHALPWVEPQALR